MENMSAISTSVQTGVIFSHYESLTPALLLAVVLAASIAEISTEEHGEVFAMARVKSVSSLDVPTDSVMILPLSGLSEGAPPYLTYLALKSLSLLSCEQNSASLKKNHNSSYNIPH